MKFGTRHFIIYHAMTLFFDLSQSIPRGLFPISSRFLWFLKYSITAFSSKSPKKLSLCHTKVYIALQPDDLSLWYFKLISFDLTEFIIWNISGLRHVVAKIKELKHLSLRQKLNLLSVSHLLLLPNCKEVFESFWNFYFLLSTFIWLKVIYAFFN